MSVARPLTEIERPIKVAVVVNSAFQWSQNFVTRELVQMAREGVELYIYALRIHNRSDLSVDERRLLSRSSQLPSNPFAPEPLRRHVVFLIKNPARYARALCQFLTFGHRRPRKIARSFICLCRAASVAAALEKLNVDIIHAHFLTAPAETAYYLSIFLGRPYGVTAHAVDIFHDNSGNARKLERAAYITTCTEYNARYLESVNHVPRERVHTIYHGLHGGRPLERARRRGRFNFLAVGRMVGKKGFEYLVDGFAEVVSQGHDTALWFVGCGPLESELRTQVEELGMADRVRFLGYVEPNRMTLVYRTAHALVVPSVIEANGDRDGIPNVCLEAMAQAMPIIGTTVSGIPEVIAEGSNGYLVEPRNAEQLAGAMTRLLTEGDYIRMGLASRKLVERKFDLGRNVDRLVGVIRFHAGGQACAA